MNSGALDRFVVIFAPVTTVDAASGGSVETFRPAGTCWAKREDTGGREYRSSSALQAEKTTLFTIRYRADLTTRHRLTCEAQNYDITDIGEVPGTRRAWLTVQAKGRLQ
jgi:hypothetical protein